MTSFGPTMVECSTPVPAAPAFAGPTDLLPDADLAAHRAWHGAGRVSLLTGEVGRGIARVGNAWYSLHGVPVGAHGSEIDHLVIGPGGVFTVNTQHEAGVDVWVHGDVVEVDGTAKPCARNSRRGAARAAKLLARAGAGIDVTVRGIVAYDGDGSHVDVDLQPAGVTVLHGKDLIAHLRSAPVVLDEAAVAAVWAVARHLSTWQPKTVARQELPDCG